VRVCPNCGEENPERARFCLSCGTAFSDEKALERQERKVVTALFADLVGFTSRAERLDPEDVRAMLSPYYARLRSELERHGGTVEKFIGDAVMAVFGAPVGHEDDPERAVRAALAIRDAVQEMNEADPELDLSVRIGVMTGEALVSLGARPTEGEGMVAGDVVNTAARLQAAAAPDSVLVGDPTYRVTERVIVYRPADAVVAKGKEKPVPAWEALEPRSRVDLDWGQRSAIPLVGRKRELAVLLDALSRVRDEQSTQLVTLVGVPGIGKSRLVWELSQEIERTSDIVLWRQGRSLPYGEGITFWALGEMVKAQAGIFEADSAESAEEKLRKSVDDLIPDESEARWIEGQLRTLVGLTAEERSADTRGESFAAWRRLFEALAERGPLVLAFEDLHWADDGMLDFVDHLVEWAGEVRLLVVCTARPELLARRPGWGGGKPNAVTLSLAPLEDEETARLLGALLGRSLLPAETQTELLTRAGGNPLYAEEYARMLNEQGGGEVADLPDSVQGIIAARIDALPSEEKELLQNAAVFGKVTWLGALASMGEDERFSVEEQLHTLERKEFLRRSRRSSVAGETEYAFRHILVRDVAYGQIPRGPRGHKHARAAGWIESLGRPEDHAEMVGHHYLAALELTRAAGGVSEELDEAARVALQQAGERAFALNAYRAAERYFEQALALWPEDDPERSRLLFRYGRSVMVQREVDGAEHLLEARDGFLATGDREGAAEAEVFLAELGWRAGANDRAFGHLAAARELVEEAAPSPVKVKVLSQAARLLMLAGVEDEAIRLGQAALAMADDLGLPGLRPHALNTVGVARANLGDRAGQAEIETSIRLAEELGSPPDVVRGYINLASVGFQFGDVRMTRDLYARAMELCATFGVGDRFVRGGFIQDLYELGEWEEALRRANDYIAEIEAGSPHYLEPVARRARALIHLAQGDVAGALSDVERMVAAGREAKDPQSIEHALATAARIFAEAGLEGQARMPADELLATGASKPNLVWSFWFVDLAIALGSIGRSDEIAVLLEKAQTVGTPWMTAGKHYLEGDFIEAADTFSGMGARAYEAFARLRAAESLVADGRRAEADVELGRALEFYRGVGATAYVRQGEALLAATA